MHQAMAVVGCLRTSLGIARAPLARPKAAVDDAQTPRAGWIVRLAALRAAIGKPKDLLVGREILPRTRALVENQRS